MPDNQELTEKELHAQKVRIEKALIAAYKKRINNEFPNAVNVPSDEHYEQQAREFAVYLEPFIKELAHTQQKLNELKDTVNDLAQANQKCDLEIEILQQALDRAVEALRAVDELWEGDEGYRKEQKACEELKWDSPVFEVWNKIKAALASIKE